MEKKPEKVIETQKERSGLRNHISLFVAIICLVISLVCSPNLLLQSQNIDKSDSKAEVTSFSKAFPIDNVERAKQGYKQENKSLWVKDICKVFDLNGSAFLSLSSDVEVKSLGKNGTYTLVDLGDSVGFIYSDFLTDTEPVKEAKNIQDNNIESISNATEESTTETQNTEVQNSKVQNTNSYSYPGICEADGYVDPSWVSIVNQNLIVVPDYILQNFVNSSWHMYVTDINIDQAYYGGQYGAVMGSTNYYESRIIIEDRYDAVYECPVHELGHWFDWYNGYPTSSNEFYQIYYAESDAFRYAFNVNFYYDNKEFFAEGFWKYWTDGVTLSQNCPQLYNFISNLL